jgi:hypothetical protein
MTKVNRIEFLKFGTNWHIEEDRLCCFREQALTEEEIKELSELAEQLQVSVSCDKIRENRYKLEIISNK